MDERRLRFCKGIVAGEAKKEAALNAGYSPKTAASIASQLLGQVLVRRKIKELTDIRDKQIAADEDARLKPSYDSPLELFMDIMNNPKLPFSVRYAAAKDAMPFIHAKPAPKGKKPSEKDAALDLVKGNKPSKLAPGVRPKLRAVS